MSKFLSYIVSLEFVESVLVVVVCFVLLSLIKKYLIKRVAYTNKDETHKNTLRGVVFNILQYIIIIGGIFIVLTINGINITGILAGLGILATIIGLSLQDTLKDIIGGINIYNNNFYKVGDVVRFQGDLWEVKYFNARVTKFKHLLSGSTYTVANSNITQIEKVKENAAYIIEFDFNTDEALIKEALTNAIPRINDIYGVREASYAGPVFITKSGIKFGIPYKVSPRLISASELQIAKICYEEMKKVGVAPANDNDIVVHNGESIEQVKKVVKTRKTKQ